MANIPENLKYLESHEWAKIEDDGTVTVGISDHAQELLGDIVFVELPQVGSSIEKQADVAVVESVKAASDVYSPVSGEIIATNENLENAPETINSSPYNDGWFFKIKPTNIEEVADLLDAEAYKQLSE
ncbi:MAG: glycine cleavage system protein H [Verrucomicrobia bacterium TMED175]|uniref:Glycine cleavage system H protein n=1 Tax=SAR86 cluster bacterium TaxID=2030880 RepID=A0A368BKC7_9GAMM|nr:MAG: glycine cleavage system protein H [Verrucomicrobia bacterium TMED175]RCL37769.1 MAG: glycine cleavage system protein GcvH [SAR86 cluster bacterium]|tara:strand:+ start:1476 stop:1859 length:384 start_codon:yes stop_codon:yes gene_type:complete